LMNLVYIIIIILKINNHLYSKIKLKVFIKEGILYKIYLKLFSVKKDIININTSKNIKSISRIYILSSLLKFKRRNKIKHEFIIMLNLINNSHIKQ
jgi:hypothetical protein